MRKAYPTLSRRLRRSVQHRILVEAAMLKDYPVAIRSLSIAAHRLVRTAGVDDVYSRLPMATKGITTWSGFATPRLKVLMYDFIILREAWWARVLVTEAYVDELTLLVTGPPQLIIEVLAEAIDFIVELLDNSVLMQLSAKKPKVIASKASIHHGGREHSKA